MSEDPMFMQRESVCSQQSNRWANRPDNTLRALTEKFVQLIQNAPNQTIQIDQASQRLSIQKRRIYDITNVLEGIGYIEKLGKNLMKWVGGLQGKHLEQEAMELDRRTLALDRKTNQIDEQIGVLQHLIEQVTRTHHNISFIFPEDIQDVMYHFGCSRLMMYSGGVGDQMALDASPNGLCTATIESKNQGSRLRYCHLKERPVVLENHGQQWEGNQYEQREEGKEQVSQDEQYEMYEAQEEEEPNIMQQKQLLYQESQSEEEQKDHDLNSH